MKTFTALMAVLIVTTVERLLRTAYRLARGKTLKRKSCHRCHGTGRVRWQDELGWSSYACPKCNETTGGN